MNRYRVNDLITTNSGFSFFELVIFILIAGILASISIPAFSAWIPEYRLRNKAKELYTDMHLAKMRAITENNKYKIVFYTDGDILYRLININGVIEKTVFCSTSNSGDKISLGSGTSVKGATKSGGTPPVDGISYTGNILTFNPRGTGSPGYVYLHNINGSSYAVGTLSSGVILMKKWDKAKNSWR